MAEPRVAMVLAGGAGTRLLPLTASIPKPMLPFCGAPFLDGLVRVLAGSGIDRVLLLVGRDEAPFAALPGRSALHGVTLEVVPEEEPLGTAGGVRAALERVDGTFLVLNGDVLTDIDPVGGVDAHRRTGASATLTLIEVEDTSTFGVCVRDGSRIVDFVEKPVPGSLPDQRAVNAGTYVLEPEALASFPPGPLSFELDVFPTLVARGDHVEGWVASGTWTDLGTCSRFLDGHRLALEGRLAWPTLDDVPADARGVRIDPTAQLDAGVVLVPPLLIGPRARVGTGARLGPNAVLGPAASIGADAHLVDSVVLERAQVGAGAHVHGAIIGPEARVEDGAEVVEGTIVGAGALLAGPSGSDGTDEG